MDTEPTLNQTESLFLSQLEKRPLPVAELLTLVHAATVTESAKKAEEWTALLMQELTEATDFPGLYSVLKDQATTVATALTPSGVRAALKKACKDRLVTALIDAASFGEVSLEESFRRLDLLLAITPDTQVIDPAWGFGIVKRLDDFYKRITIDFVGKPGHTMPFATACENLSLAPHDHLLTLRHADPEGMVRLTKEQPGELVSLALRSFGDMPVTRLEDVLVKNGFISAANWKSFWELARKALKNDPLVTIPAKRADALKLRSQAESYGEAWFDNLAATKDPLKILEAITEFEATGKMAGLEANPRGVLEDRLSFAIKGAYNTDASLYARLAVMVSRLGFLTPPVEQLRAHLWEQHRYIKASKDLAVRDISAMVLFLLAEGGHADTNMLGSLQEMPFSLLNETLSVLKTSPQAEVACRALLSRPKAPPTLVNWIFRFRKEVAAWQLPPLIDLLNHAIVIVEGRLNGEALRMQNNLKQLFEQPKWFDAVFEELNELQRQLFFDRIQASTAWDPSTHRSLIGRMLKLDPLLSERKKALPTQQANIVHWTSWRSLAEHQLLHKKLIEVDLPKNSHDISVARSYGDLRENFEYQAAKDLQRQLLQRQAEMQMEFKQIKGTDFNDATADKVGPGTTVVLRMADNSHRTYSILGEWDSARHLNIISNKTRLALCLEGKVAGDQVQIPSQDGEEAAIVEAVRPLDPAVREWISSPPEESL